MKNDVSVFIKNNRQYQSTFVVKATKEVEDGEGNKTKRAFVKFTKVFEPLRTDPVTGNLLSTGYTEVSKAEFADLMKLKVFSKFIEKGSFVYYDEAPEGALLDSQIVSSLRSENNSLKERIKELETLIGVSLGGKEKENTKKKSGGKNKPAPVEAPPVEEEEGIDEEDESSESSETPEF